MTRCAAAAAHLSPGFGQLAVELRLSASAGLAKGLELGIGTLELGIDLAAVRQVVGDGSVGLLERQDGEAFRHDRLGREPFEERQDHGVERDTGACDPEPPVAPLYVLLAHGAILADGAEASPAKILRDAQSL